ncbi:MULTISPECIES: LolA-like outer membrane lipoprotein chaperone [unclassified Campylobacter]|uniref:LolA-like outer membrane lipoprotein chaperone n=2 Tax=Campylobacter TaxID=194 RepID=UPI001BDA9BBF|nr:LolA-like outer membrane lipoprotein chaperone [Campylobacter sp. 2018MI10]MBZ7976792.1 outer-membrane lipoprotein carrier protein LolA [Campylobacter sp. RM12637]MBZ7978460.1 outer-membrane lipoprotein carrier protein LolA [Campylobacter sp. RM12654]MBZ7980259.1 outer-membrane lipoprotein carrier protein LolA [Campylobacter sp. RM12642]MBZ7982320.1 outer-membrane lipoprotein carrier protein LolA [Campylobacter sp. RM12640]MBZ7989526.1 outer-membrane lipoprotein carrier protein LolA [Campyl
MIIKKIFLLCICGIFAFAFKIDNINYNSFEADFIQKVVDLSNKTLIYEGKFYYQNEKSLWQYLNPDEKKVYITKNEVVIIDDDLEQVIISKEQIDLANILKNVSLYEKKEDFVIYKAKYDNIIYYVKVLNNLLTNISYKDELDNQVSIDFINSKINLKINDDIFKYSIPKNYDVIR